MDKVSKSILTMMAGGIFLISVIISVGASGELSAIKDNAAKVASSSKKKEAEASSAATHEEESPNEAEEDDEDIEEDFSDYGEPIIELAGDDQDGDDDSGDDDSGDDRTEDKEAAAAADVAATEEVKEAVGSTSTVAAEQAEVAAAPSGDSEPTQNTGISGNVE